MLKPVPPRPRAPAGFPHTLLLFIIVLFSYVEWICRAEDLVLAEERTTEDDRKLIMEAREKAAAKIKKLSHTQKQDSVETNSLEEGGI